MDGGVGLSLLFTNVGTEPGPFVRLMDKDEESNMEAIRLHKTVEKDGEIMLTGLPCRKGQSVEMIVLIDDVESSARPYLTAKQLSQSGLVGLWKDRDDIGESSDYARHLRERA